MLDKSQISECLSILMGILMSLLKIKDCLKFIYTYLLYISSRQTELT
jgi:hypothetical protein